MRNALIGGFPHGWDGSRRLQGGSSLIAGAIPLFREFVYQVSELFTYYQARMHKGARGVECRGSLPPQAIEQQLERQQMRHRLQYPRNGQEGGTRHVEDVIEKPVVRN